MKRNEPRRAEIRQVSLALVWFGHVTLHESLSKIILQDTLGGGRCRGRQKKCWMDNVKEWTLLSLLEVFTMAEKSGGGSLLNRPS